MDVTTYMATDLARYIVNKCIADGKPISNFTLQKILYLVQLAVIKETGDLAFYDDIEAWKFGPVVPLAYYDMCGNGAMTILTPYKLKEEPTGPVKVITDRIVDEKRDMEPFALKEEIEATGSPWKRVYNDGKGNKEIIPLAMMYDYVQRKKEWSNLLWWL